MDITLFKIGNYESTVFNAEILTIETSNNSRSLLSFFYDGCTVWVSICFLNFKF